MKKEEIDLRQERKELLLENHNLTVKVFELNLANKELKKKLSLYGVVDSLTTKEAIDYEVMRKRQDKEENLQSWVFAGVMGLCIIVGLLVLLKSCTS